ARAPAGWRTSRPPRMPEGERPTVHSSALAGVLRSFCVRNCRGAAIRAQSPVVKLGRQSRVVSSGSTRRGSRPARYLKACAPAPRSCSRAALLHGGGAAHRLPMAPPPARLGLPQPTPPPLGHSIDIWGGWGGNVSPAEQSESHRREARSALSALLPSRGGVGWAPLLLLQGVVGGEMRRGRTAVADPDRVAAAAVRLDPEVLAGAFPGRLLEVEPESRCSRLHLRGRSGVAGAPPADQEA